MCEVCQKDCGYKQDLYIHMKKHELNGEWKRSDVGPMSQNSVETVTKTNTTEKINVNKVPLEKVRKMEK